MTTKKYRPANYSVEIELAKTTTDIFNDLIDLKKWWPEDYTGENLRLNAEFELRTGDDHHSRNRVIEFLPNQKVVWLATEAIRETDSFDWSGSKFIFELTPHESNTIVKFTYDGVVFEDEYEKLTQICEITIKDMFYNFIINGKAKS